MSEYLRFLEQELPRNARFDPDGGVDFVAYHTNPNTEQTGFRGRDDSQTLNSATFTHANNTNWTQLVDTTFRVRIEAEEDAGGTGSIGGQLEYSHNGGAFTNVTTSSSVVRAVASAQFNEGDATTNVLTNSANTFVAGDGVEDGLAGAVSVTNQHTENEYALQILSADVANNDTIQLRIAGLNVYTQVPTITVQEPSTVTGAAVLAGTGTVTAAGAATLSGTVRPGRTYEEAVVATNPLGRWKLAEGSGTNADDATSNNRDGTYSGTYTQGVTSIIPNVADTCVDFTSGRVDIADHADWDFSSSFTFSWWMHPDGVSGFPSPLSLGSSGWFVHYQTQQLTLRYGIDRGVLGDTPSTLAVGNTYHCVISYDRAATRLRMYINGTQRGSDNIVDIGTDPGAGLVIATDGAFPHNGKLQDVTVYNAELTPAQVREIYLAGAATTDPIKGTATIAAVGDVSKTGAAVLAGTGTLAAAATVEIGGAAALTGTATLGLNEGTVVLGPADPGGLPAPLPYPLHDDVSSAQTHSAAASLTGTGTLAPNGRITATGVASLVASGATVSAAVGTFIGQAVLSGTATLASNGRITATGVANLQGSATLASAGTVTRNAAAALAGAGTVAANAVATFVGAAALLGSATLAPNGRIDATGVSSMTGTATVTSDGRITATGTTNLTGTATIAANASLLGTQTANALLEGTATLAATGRATFVGAAALLGSATLAPNGRITATGASVLAGAATVNPPSSVTHPAQASLVASGSQVTAAVGTFVGAAILASSATMVSVGRITATGISSLTGSATITAAPKATFVGAAALSGTATLTGTAFTETIVDEFLPTTRLYAVPPRHSHSRRL